MRLDLSLRTVDWAQINKNKFNLGDWTLRFCLLQNHNSWVRGKNPEQGLVKSRSYSLLQENFTFVCYKLSSDNIITSYGTFITIGLFRLGIIIIDSESLKTWKPFLILKETKLFMTYIYSRNSQNTRLCVRDIYPCSQIIRWFVFKFHEKPATEYIPVLWLSP